MVYVSFRTRTSAVKVTASLTRKPASRSNSVVRVRNSRHPQSFACLLYLQAAGRLGVCHLGHLPALLHRGQASR